MEVKRQKVESLVEKLGSVSDQTRAEALAELRYLTKHDADSRPLIAEAGSVPYLSENLYSTSHEFQDNAAATLLNLSISSRDSLMSSRGLLDAISHSLRHHKSNPPTSPEAVQSCAATLHSLLVFNEENRIIIGAKRDIVFSLVDVIRTSASPPRSIKDALKALFGIALYKPNRSTMIELGALTPLFSLVVKDSRMGIVEDASAVVAQIAGCEESVEALRKVSGVRVLADLLDPGTGLSCRIRENAVSALLNLVRCGGDKALKEVTTVATAEEGMMEGIADIAESGSAKGKTKAMELLKVVIGGCNDDDIDSRYY